MTSFTLGPAYVGTPGNVNDPPRPKNTSRFGSGYYITDGTGNPIYDERTDHPMLFAPYIVRSRPSVNLQLSPGQNFANRTFGVEEVRNLNRKYNYDSYVDSHLALLAPATLGNPVFRNGQLNARFATTVLNTDIDLPGAVAVEHQRLYVHTRPKWGATSRSRRESARRCRRRTRRRPAPTTTTLIART